MPRKRPTIRKFSISPNVYLCMNAKRTYHVQIQHKSLPKDISKSGFTKRAEAERWRDEQRAAWGLTPIQSETQPA